MAQLPTADKGAEKFFKKNNNFRLANLKAFFKP